MSKSVASQLSHQRWYARNRARENEKQRQRYHKRMGRATPPPKRPYTHHKPAVVATVHVDRTRTVVHFD